MTLEKAIEQLRITYEQAERLSWVQNKTAWALYQVWRIADAKPSKKAEKGDTFQQYLDEIGVRES